MGETLIWDLISLVGKPNVCSKVNEWPVEKPFKAHTTDRPFFAEVSKIKNHLPLKAMRGSTVNVHYKTAHIF